MTYPKFSPVTLFQLELISFYYPKDYLTLNENTYQCIQYWQVLKASKSWTGNFQEYNVLIKHGPTYIFRLFYPIATAALTSNWQNESPPLLNKMIFFCFTEIAVLFIREWLTNCLLYELASIHIFNGECMNDFETKIKRYGCDLLKLFFSLETLYFYIHYNNKTFNFHNMFFKLNDAFELIEITLFWIPHVRREWQ